MTDLLVLASLFALAAAGGALADRWYTGRSEAAARRSGYAQGLLDAADACKAADAARAAETAELEAENTRLQDEAALAHRDLAAAIVRVVGLVRALAASDAYSARHHAAWRSARRRAGRERTLNDDLVDELADAHPVVQDAETAQLRRLVDNLAARLATLQAANETLDIPADLYGAITPEEWRDLVAAAADPIRERLGQDPQVRRMRRAGRFLEAERLEKHSRNGDAKAGAL